MGAGFIMNENYSNLWDRLQKSKFRSRFCLGESEKKYCYDKGEETIRRHAEDFVRQRLAPAVIANDGKQTPMRGHPVFIAQHATACCCRECLFKWHGIRQGCEMTDYEQKYVVNILMEWIHRQIEG